MIVSFPYIFFRSPCGIEYLDITFLFEHLQNSSNHFNIHDSIEFISKSILFLLQL